MGKIKVQHEFKKEITDQNYDIFSLLFSILIFICKNWTYFVYKHVFYESMYGVMSCVSWKTSTNLIFKDKGKRRKAMRKVETEASSREFFTSRELDQLESVRSDLVDSPVDIEF